MDTRRGYIFYFRCILCKRLSKLEIDVMPLNQLETATYQTLCANCYWNHVIAVHGPNLMRDVDAKGEYENEAT